MVGAVSSAPGSACASGRSHAVPHPAPAAAARRAQSAQQYLATLGDAPTARTGIQGTNLGRLTKDTAGGQLNVGSPSGKVFLSPGAPRLLCAHQRLMTARFPSYGRTGKQP